MSLRTVVVSALALLTAGCLGGARLERPLPQFVGDIATVASVEIADESGAVILSGQFSEPQVTGNVTLRVAELSGSETSAAGSVTLETVSSGEGELDETVRIELEGLKYPSLYRLRINQKQVSVFSATLSDQVSLSLSRSSAERLAADQRQEAAKKPEAIVAREPAQLLRSGALLK